MRKSDLKKRHEPFDAAVSRYRSFAQKIISAQRVIGTAEEKRDLSESIVLRVVAHWENFVDEHIVACANRDHSKLNQFFGIPIPSHPHMNLCRALIFGDGYRDFQSMGALVGFSKKLLPDSGNPFLAISASNKNKIDDIYKIRNYLAHYSAKSERTLRAMYKSKYQRDRWVEPGKFLLQKNATQLWACFDAFEGASHDMKTWY